MQSSEIISVNLWQIIISLCNLTILFLLLKRFLFAPVKRTVKKRQEEITSQYDRAAEAEKKATELKQDWESRISQAENEADTIIQTAEDTAQARKKALIDEGKKEADAILRRAEENAELEMKRAQDGIRKEIVSVSAALSEKLLKRELSKNDSDRLFDEFLSDLGDGDEG